MVESVRGSRGCRHSAASSGCYCVSCCCHLYIQRCQSCCLVRCCYLLRWVPMVRRQVEAGYGTTGGQGCVESVSKLSWRAYQSSTVSKREDPFRPGGHHRSKQTKTAPNRRYLIGLALLIYWTKHGNIRYYQHLRKLTFRVVHSASPVHSSVKNPSTKKVVDPQLSYGEGWRISLYAGQKDPNGPSA